MRYPNHVPGAFVRASSRYGDFICMYQRIPFNNSEQDTRFERGIILARTTCAHPDEVLDNGVVIDRLLLLDARTQRLGWAQPLWVEIA